MNCIRGTALVAATVLAFSPFAASAQQQGGLVNIAIEDVANNNTVVVQVPLSVAIQVCDVAVNVLAKSIRTGTTECTIDQDTAAAAGIG